MSEWAYRNCICGNRVHLSTTYDKCNGDPWGVREDIKTHINILEKERSECKKRTAALTKKINELKIEVKLDLIWKTNILQSGIPMVIPSLIN